MSNLRDNETKTSGVSRNAKRKMICDISGFNTYGNMFDRWFNYGVLVTGWRRDYGMMTPGEWLLCTINGLVERVTIVCVSPLGFYECVDCDGNRYTINCPGIGTDGW